MALSRWKSQIHAHHFGHIISIEIVEVQRDQSEIYEDWQDLAFTGDKPISLQYNYSQELFSPFIALGATLNLMVNYDGQYSKFGFSERDKQFKATIFKDGEIIFVGFVLNELYEEPHTFVENYPIQVQLSDSLNLLKRTIRGSVGNTTGLWNAQEKKSLQNVLWEVLADTGISLDLEIQNALYPVQSLSLPDIAQLSPFALQLVEPQVWQSENGYKSDYKILEDILKSSLCSVFQHKGRWKIRRDSDLNRSADDFTVPFVNSLVYSFASQYETRTQVISTNESIFIDVANNIYWKGTNASISQEKGIEAQTIKLDWVQRPNFLINGDFEDGFRSWGATEGFQEIQQAPTWIFVDPVDSTKKVNVSNYVSNNVLGWTNESLSGERVFQPITVPPLPSGSTLSLKFSCAITDLTQASGGWLTFGVYYKDNHELVPSTGISDTGVSIIPLANDPIYADSFSLVVANENPFDDASNSTYALAADISLSINLPFNRLNQYTDLEIVFFGWSALFGVQPVVVDKIAITAEVSKGSTATNQNQVETFYGGIDKQSFRKQGEEISVGLGSPSNEAYLSTLWYPLEGTPVSPSAFNHDNYTQEPDSLTTALSPHEITYTIPIDAVKIVSDGVLISFTGIYDIDWANLGGDNLNEGTFKDNGTYITLNGIKIQCYASFGWYWGRRGVRMNIVSDEVALSAQTINSISLTVKVLAQVHSGGGNCLIQSRSILSATYRVSGYAPIIDYRNLSEKEDRTNLDNQLCDRLMQSVLTTRHLTTRKMRGTLICPTMITPNTFIEDKYLKDSEGNYIKMKPSSITYDCLNSEYEVETIEIINKSVTKA